MNGMQKLKVSISILLALSVLFNIGAIMLRTIEDNNTQNLVNKAYDEMTLDEQTVLQKYYNKLNIQEYSILDTIVGWLSSIVSVGLLILLAKIWGMKKI